MTLHVLTIPHDAVRDFRFMFASLVVYVCVSRVGQRPGPMEAQGMDVAVDWTRSTPHLLFVIDVMVLHTLVLCLIFRECSTLLEHGQLCAFVIFSCSWCAVFGSCGLGSGAKNF
jgi:hypothetical protein